MPYNPGKCDRCKHQRIRFKFFYVAPSMMASYFCWRRVFVEGAREARGFFPMFGAGARALGAGSSRLGLGFDVRGPGFEVWGLGSRIKC